MMVIFILLFILMLSITLDDIDKVIGWTLFGVLFLVAIFVVFPIRLTRNFILVALHKKKYLCD